MTMLADQVEVVIGVDTHKRFHVAAVVSAATSGVLARATISTGPDGYDELYRLAAGYGRRSWSIEGTASYWRGSPGSCSTGASR
jgi:hypothetical protein